MRAGSLDKFRPSQWRGDAVNRVDQADRAAEYDRQYRAWVERSLARGERTLDIEWRLKHLLWRHKVLLRRYDVRGKKVLDHGCMDGVFSIALQRAGAHVTGLDVSPAAIAQAKTFRGNAPEPVFTLEPPTRGDFDIVFSNEVIEHMPDDQAFAGELASFVRPGGFIIGTTPVGRSFWDPDHKRLYNERLLRRALQPWGKVKIGRYYRSPLRNLIPIVQSGAAVFIFEVEKIGRDPIAR